MNTRQAKKLEQIKRFRYIDDTFFSVALDKFKPGVELILQIVTENPGFTRKNRAYAGNGPESLRQKRAF